MERGCDWHGTVREWDDLALAVDQNCECVQDGMGRLISLCAAHRLLEDQHALDRLVFERRIANRLRAVEFSVSPHVQEVPWR